MKKAGVILLALILALMPAMISGCSVPESVTINLGDAEEDAGDFDTDEGIDDGDEEEEDVEAFDDYDDAEDEAESSADTAGEAVKDPFYRKLNDMQYVLLSMAYGLSDDPELGQKGSYTAGKDDYWSMLMYLADYNSYDENGPFSKKETADGSYIYIPEDVTLQYISAFDPDFDGKTPEIAEDSPRSGAVFYDEMAGEFSFMRGDMGLAVPTLFGFLDNEDGTFTVYSGLMDVELAAEETDPRKYIDKYSRISLVKNPYADTIDDPVYFYSVKTAETIDREEFEEAEDKLEVFDGYADKTGKRSENDAGNEEGDDSGSTFDTSGEYILPGSDGEYKSKDEISALSDEELRLARNELYARHGRKFKDQKLSEYFEGKSWYNGTRDDVPDKELNEYEIANRDLIVEEEKKRQGGK